MAVSNKVRLPKVTYAFASRTGITFDPPFAPKFSADSWGPGLRR